MTSPAAHDILTERVFPVPRSALFAAFADPAVLATWWGPTGSTSVFARFDFRPGGAWLSVMRGADGSEWPMTNEFVEVVAPERIVLRHVQEGHGFELDMRYEALDAGRARLRWRMRFDDPAEAARVRPFVVAANEQNFDRLAAAVGLAPAGSVSRRAAET